MYKTIISVYDDFLDCLDCLYLSFCLCVALFLSRTVLLSPFCSLSLSLSFCLLSFSLFCYVSLSVLLSVLFLSVFLCLSLCFAMSLSLALSLSLSFCLFIYVLLFVCLFVLTTLCCSLSLCVCFLASLSLCIYTSLSHFVTLNSDNLSSNGSLSLGFLCLPVSISMCVFSISIIWAFLSLILTSFCFSLSTCPSFTLSERR
jgi:hypothetical protein